jgi:hypothetical protein
VLVDGQELGGALWAEVVQNQYYMPDTFEVRFAFNAPKAGGLVWWSQVSALLLTIQASADGKGWTDLILGQVDHVDLHPATGTAIVQGRDLTAMFQDARTQNAWRGKTASEVVLALNALHKGPDGKPLLTPFVTATTPLVDSYYGGDHTKVTLGEFSRITTEWGLITYLAERNGFDAFVRGKGLYFRPQADPDTAQASLTVNYAPASLLQPAPVSDVIDLRMERSLTLAKDIEVAVRSWRSDNARGFTKLARRLGARSANAAFGGAQRYVYVRPNMTEEQAQQFANTALAELSQHERVITFRRPFDPALDTDAVVRLSGTGTGFDQKYHIDTITTVIGFEDGAYQSIRAKNHDVQTQAQVA